VRGFGDGEVITERVPETSELFSATFARYVAVLFEELGSPASFHFVECGAGDGSFAEGMLATLRDCFPAMYEATTYYIDEINLNRPSCTR
jgi:SAM-dependent MidA family methyltransferase